MTSALHMLHLRCPPESLVEMPKRQLEQGCEMHERGWGLKYKYRNHQQTLDSRTAFSFQRISWAKHYAVHFTALLPLGF